MDITIENSKDKITLDKSNYLSAGGEGEIYTLPSQILVKIYHDDQITSSRQQKVLELCSKYVTYRSLFNQEQFAFPQVPASRLSPGEIGDSEIVGFAMSDLGRHPQLDSIGFDEHEFKKDDGRCLTDDTAISLIYDLYDSLHKLHTSHLVLGDLNPSNILYNFDTSKPCCIDVDSASFGKFHCIAHSDNYVDPLVEEAGKNAAGLYKFTTLSDCYALAVIAYELFVGSHPFWFRSKDGMNVPDRKRKRIALMGHLEDSDFLVRMGSNLLDHQQNTLLLERLRVLKSKDHRLYQYLFDTLIRDRRENLLIRLPKTDKRNPAYVFHAKGKVKTIADVLQEGFQQSTQSGGNIKPPQIGHPSRPKTSIFDDEVKDSFFAVLQKFQRQPTTTETSDPKMFTLFLANMGIDYQQLVQQGVQAHA